jgi:hypothetical protein
LGAIAVDMEKALVSDDTEAMDRLAVQHEEVMETLRLNGNETDMGMKGAITEAEEKIKKLISTIKTMQTDIRSQLSAMNNRRLIQSTYHSKDAR